MNRFLLEIHVKHPEEPSLVLEILERFLESFVKTLEIFDCDIVMSGVAEEMEEKMSKKKQTKFNPENGHYVVDYAKGHSGVELHHKKDGRTVIKTDRGSMQVYDNKQPYSESDKSNVRRWLKILGLLVLIPLCTWLVIVQQIRAGH